MHTTAWKRAVKKVTLQDGVVLVGSDMHYWPGQERSTAHSALVRLSRTLQPRVVIANGDVMDFPSISVHPSIGWEGRPTVAQEIKAAQERLFEIEEAASEAELYWTAGNHDLRYETYLAKVAQQYAEIYGMHLHDHFPEWAPCWMVNVNDTLMVKHRWKGGIHAAYNNAVQSGRTICTGHLHSPKVIPYSDYNGTRYGVDGGCIARPYDEQFIHYTEANPVNWISAFAVFTFVNGVLLPPELCMVLDEAARLTCFRGVVYEEE